jgi:lipopolysaccharide/colanic/teichoic acid biosynthesis glycosyltransferase
MRLKRIFDIIASLFGIIILIPLFVSIYILIKILMPGRALFLQKRVGRNGKLFTIYKFRTMIANHSSSSISVAGENHITPLGTILRKYKFDELPELWNVLIGEMSFVGPRPDVSGYADKVTGENQKILILRPGITGPASLKYSNEEYLLSKVSDPIKYNDQVIYPDKVRINLKYYYNHSIIGDIKIILKTIFRLKY